MTNVNTGKQPIPLPPPLNAQATVREFLARLEAAILADCHPGRFTPVPGDPLLISGLSCSAEWILRRCCEEVNFSFEQKSLDEFTAFATIVFDASSRILEVRVVHDRLTTRGLTLLYLHVMGHLAEGHAVARGPGFWPILWELRDRHRLSKEADARCYIADQWVTQTLDDLARRVPSENQVMRELLAALHEYEGRLGLPAALPHLVNTLLFRRSERYRRWRVKPEVHGFISSAHRKLDPLFKFPSIVTKRLNGPTLAARKLVGNVTRNTPMWRS